MIEEIRILLHLAFVVLVSGNDRRFIQTKNHQQRIPVFNRTPDNYTFEAGELAVLKCDVENLGKRRVGWRRASQPTPLTIGTMTFVDDDRISVDHTPFTTEWNLLIKKVQVEDAGVYECQVASKVRHLRKLILLTVKESKEEVKDNIQITGEEYVEQDKEIYLICNATGKEHSPDDLDWFKNGNKLTTEFARKLYIRKFVSLTTKTIVSTLRIKNAQLHDAGVYVCRTSDLQITSRRINVLKTEKENVKRGTPTQGPTDGNSAACLTSGFVQTLLLTIASVLTASYTQRLITR